MRDGIQAALVASYHHMLVEGDNKVVIQAIQGYIHIPWQIQTLIRDIYIMIPPNVHCLFQHTYREGNMTVAWVAKYGCSIRSTSIFSFSFPSNSEFLSIPINDNLGRTLERRAT